MAEVHTLVHATPRPKKV